ncbi:MAG: MFS transporter [Rikenellaceae bacterium]
MKIQTGKGTISLITLIAIWSISLVVNLPGLAISPLMNDLTTIFPDTSQLEIQLLTILPNLFIIPFVLLSGRLSISRNKMKIVVVALVIYLVSAILYFFAKNMIQLIIISSLLGIGCGLVIPLAAGLITDFFVGKYRMKQLGIKSGIANLSLVFATIAAGILAKTDWHLPFLVYMIPIIPLMLSIYIKPNTEPLSLHINTNTEGIYNPRKLWGVIALYGTATYLVISISYYLPFLAGSYGISSKAVGIITSLFFLSIMLPGFFLSQITSRLKNNTIFISMATIALGLLLISLGKSNMTFGTGAIFLGIGYGIIQPLAYDKAAIIGGTNKSTLMLSYTLAMNYVAVTIAPFVIDLVQKIFDSHSERFPFIMNLVICTIFCIVIYLNGNNFAFSFKESQD